MNNLFYNLYVAFKVFNNKGLAVFLHVDKHKLDVWRDRIESRPTGDFYNAIVTACKENNILLDDIFSDNIIERREERAREEGRLQAFKEIAVEFKKATNIPPGKTHGPAFRVTEEQGQKEMKHQAGPKQIGRTD